MAISKYVSEVKYIYKDTETVFNYLSNFENLSKYLNDSLLQKISGQIEGIDEIGRLLIKKESGELASFQFKEVEYAINI